MENKTLVLGKDIQQIKELNALKLEELAKVEANLKTQLENKTNLLATDIQQLKEKNLAKEAEMATIKNSIQSLNESYKNISDEENGLEAKLTRMINSLKAFYASMILMDDTTSKTEQVTRENQPGELPEKK